MSEDENTLKTPAEAAVAGSPHGACDTAAKLRQTAHPRQALSVEGFWLVEINSYPRELNDNIGVPRTCVAGPCCPKAATRRKGVSEPPEKHACLPALDQTEGKHARSRPT